MTLKNSLNIHQLVYIILLDILKQIHYVTVDRYINSITSHAKIARNFHNLVFINDVYINCSSREAIYET